MNSAAAAVGDRAGENGVGIGAAAAAGAAVDIGDGHMSGGRLGSGSACCWRHCQSSLRCEPEWPYGARKPRGRSRTRSWLG